MSDRECAIVELTLSGTTTFGDLMHFVSIVESLGASPSSPVVLRWDSMLVRQYLARLAPAGRPRDPDTGRFVRVAS